MYLLKPRYVHLLRCLFMGFEPNYPKYRTSSFVAVVFFFLHLKLSSRNWSEKHPLISAVQDQACFRNSTNICNVSITGCPWERSAFLSLLGQYILASFQISFLLTNNRRDISQELIMEKKTQNFYHFPCIQMFDILWWCVQGYVPSDFNRVANTQYRWNLPKFIVQALSPHLL